MPALVAVRVVNRLGGFGMSFLGVRLARDLGLGLDQVGWVLAVFGACTIPSRILGGVLATRLGCRGTIALGLFTCGAAQLGIALGSTASVVIAAVLALGLAYEVIEPATQGLVAETVESGRHASAFALMWAALAVAGVVSGLLAALLGRWGLPALFLADAASSLLASAATLLLLPGTPVARSATGWRSAIGRGLLTWTGVGTAYATLVMIVVFMLPLAVDREGHGTSMTGVLLAAAAAAAIGAQRGLARLETRMPPRVVLVIGHAVLAAGLALWATGTLPGLVTGALLEGASGTLLLGTYQATAARLSPPGTAPVGMAVFGLSWGVATVVAPVAGSILLAQGPGLLWLAVAVGSSALGMGHAVARPGSTRPPSMPVGQTCLSGNESLR